MRNASVGWLKATYTEGWHRGLLVALVGVFFALPACSSTRPSESAAGIVAGETPSWVVEYDDAQKAVLGMPQKTAVRQRATPVYPDLARFTFANERQVSVPDDLLDYARLVSETLSASPRLYVFRTGPASLANLRHLYGPEPETEPDAWQRVAPDSHGRNTLVESVPADEEQLLGIGANSSANGLSILRIAASREPDVPGVQVILADALLAAGDTDGAEAAARVAIATDPFYPRAHRVLAEVGMRRNDTAAGLHAIARALALYPRYEHAWKIAEALVGYEIVRAATFEQPFIGVNADGAVVVVTSGRPFSVGYASCKAAFRYEPGFRSAILQDGGQVPYHLSSTEEVVCLQVGLGTHIQSELSKPGSASDPTAELLIRLASEAGLTAYALFDVLGEYRPEWLRIAPPVI
ncbi:MAG: hypothetical protein FWD57_05545, partial [Polyangiaceae bacterium]|nr:hypothetical protein [Polyangiaceae bacterium]